MTIYLSTILLQVIISDLNGKVLMSKKLESSSGEVTNLDVSILPKGIFMVSIKDENAVKSIRLVRN